MYRFSRIAHSHPVSLCAKFSQDLNDFEANFLTLHSSVNGIDLKAKTTNKLHTKEKTLP